ncbi:uncharacterized protein Z520_07280 [Fonsecaea multimorphosa CBS 102226]|uniref:Uncharacterized protein n=1 Tax=Fonsecaea multimorphosa CBS 102226 TaxID=1442371 RepID=A0A0D2IJC7_9EURO|nr:uncharacterized protein Z520_07280 [Fonsecaea multimorphosa CBS 102226]KIX97166.1 hypothetical protein Z520_07280 [Fonsecaea multimorphosa CBS 102226]OAL22941.1 hypothetical protein AYO22_06849 [Fonsecaea multimorphosa]
MAATTQRRRHHDPAACDPKCFPYVMHPSSTKTITTTTTGKQRHRSSNSNHSRNLSLTHSYHGAPLQWQEPVPRPATANPALNPSHDPAQTQTARHTRSRSRLQKRPSQQQMLKKSASVSAMSQIAPPPRRRPSLDPKDLTPLPRLPDHVVPRRSSSLRKKSLPGAIDRPKSKKGSSDEPKSAAASTTHASLSLRPKSSPAEQPSPKTDSDSEKSSPAGSPGRPAPIRAARHQPLAPNDPSPLNPLYHIPSSYFAHVPITDTTTAVTSPSPNSTSEKNSEHAILLPTGFKPGKSEHTEVEEVIRPAVTHEVVKRDTKEIVQEEITREIHVHHYYTYTQPIKAVEIRPARHFLVDAETGKKVEIPAPEGWVMPSNLQPYKPDLSGVSAATRHYLVDEEHPTGVTEPAPLNVKKKGSSQDLRPTRKASSTGNWTPFPRVR